MSSNLDNETKIKEHIIDYILSLNIKNINTGNSKKIMNNMNNINDNDLLGLLIKRMIKYISILYDNKKEITEDKLYDMIKGTNLIDKIDMLLEFYEDGDIKKNIIKFTKIIKKKINENIKKYNFYNKKLNDSERKKRIDEIKNIISREKNRETNTESTSSNTGSTKSTSSNTGSTKSTSSNTGSTKSTHSNTKNTGSTHSNTKNTGSTHSNTKNTGSTHSNTKNTGSTHLNTKNTGSTHSNTKNTGSTHSNTEKNRELKIKIDKIIINNYFYDILINKYNDNSIDTIIKESKEIYKKKLSRIFHTNRGGNKESFQYLNNIKGFLSEHDNVHNLTEHDNVHNLKRSYLNNDFKKIIEKYKDDKDISYFIIYVKNAKPIPFSNKLIKSLDNYLNKKKRISSLLHRPNELPNLLKDYNLILSEKIIDQVKLDKIKDKIIVKINNHKNNTKYKNIEGINGLLDYMKIRKFENFYIIDNDIIDKSKILGYLPKFKDNNEIKNKNLSNI